MDLGLGFDQAAIGMALVGLNGRFLRVKRALCELLGRSEAELLGSAITDLGEPGDDPVLADLGRAATRQGGQAAFQVERSCRRADGTRLDLLRGDQPEAAADFERLLDGEELWAKRPVGDVIFDVHYRPLLDPDGRVAGVVSVAVDVTDLERVERERRHLLGQLITAQEEERRRLAGDLHDDAVQSLTAARMHLSILDQVVARPAGEAAATVQPVLDHVHENLEQGLVAARTFLFNLRPPLLDSAGLEPALRQQLAKLAERTGCKAVADDGVGFDPQVAGERAAATGHLGLRSMAERIQTAGGQLELSSQPYQGTQVVLRLPG